MGREGGGEENEMNSWESCSGDGVGSGGEEEDDPSVREIGE